ncbi:MAG: hypothetical protein ACKVT1_00455 [Dehalococcoidia bacterium]
MAQLRLDAAEFPGRLDEALDRLRSGDCVLVEHGGAIVAEVVLSPRPTASERPGSAQRFVEELAGEAPLDDDFRKAVLEAVAFGNQPAESAAWPP